MGMRLGWGSGEGARAGVMQAQGRAGPGNSNMRPPDIACGAALRCEGSLAMVPGLVRRSSLRLLRLLTSACSARDTKVTENRFHTW